MTSNDKGSGKYILLIRVIEDAKVRYFTAKKLFELFPKTPIMEWKNQLDKKETLVLMRSDAYADLNQYKKEIDSVCTQADIVEQKTIGRAKIF